MRPSTSSTRTFRMSSLSCCGPRPPLWAGTW
jgi:hypothetical protein